jgi:hypothetical protein
LDFYTFHASLSGKTGECGVEERRKLERFELRAPARIVLQSGSNRSLLDKLTTRDISSSGAYVYSSHSLPEGANVRMDLVITLEALQKLAGENSTARIRVKGKVVRSDSDGVAIKFESGYRITALEKQ